MPLYECVFIARQDISSNQVEGLVGQFTGIIEEHGGQVAKSEMWGLRNLAYKINKNRKGHYALLNLDAPAAAIHEMERNMRLSEDVIRYLTIRVEELEEGPSVVIQSKHSRDDRGGRGGRGGGFRGGDRGGGRGDDRGGGRHGDGPRASAAPGGDGEKSDKKDVGKDETPKAEAAAKPEEKTEAKAAAKPEKETAEAKPKKETAEAKPEKETAEAKPENETAEAKPEKKAKAKSEKTESDEKESGE